MLSHRWADKQQGDTPSISFFLEGLSSQFKVLGVYIKSVMIKSKFTLRRSFLWSESVVFGSGDFYGFSGGTTGFY